MHPALAANVIAAERRKVVKAIVNGFLCRCQNNLTRFRNKFSSLGSCWHNIWWADPEIWHRTGIWACAAAAREQARAEDFSPRSNCGFVFQWKETSRDLASTDDMAKWDHCLLTSSVPCLWRQFKYHCLERSQQTHRVLWVFCSTPTLFFSSSSIIGCRCTFCTTTIFVRKPDINN